MMLTPRRRMARLCALAAAAALSSLTGAVHGAQPPESPLAKKEFFRPELYLSDLEEHYDDVAARLPNQAAWLKFRDTYGPDIRAYVDPRSGTPSNIVLHVPVVPGSGVGNTLTLEDVGRRVGRTLRRVDEGAVATVLQRFISEQKAVLAVDDKTLGPGRATRVHDDLWHVSFPQVVDGVAVRDAEIVATISHGNLVLIGTETWGAVRVGTVPQITAADALFRGLKYVELDRAAVEVWKEPALELIPYAPREYEEGDAYRGPIGSGYGHYLAWVWGFSLPKQTGRWEVMIDAATGEVLSLQDVLQSADQVVGGIYPVTNSEVCPSPGRCGTLQPGTPMPFADTGRSVPNDFTNSAGLAQGSGFLATRLQGRFFKIQDDSCGTLFDGTTGGRLDLLGTNGDHDCDHPAGRSDGDTAAARTTYYEGNRIAEIARGWLPNNAWLNTQVPANVNIQDVCNAFWDHRTQSLNFFASGNSCVNTGEIASVIAHEWGHGLDDNDSNGKLSNSSEAYADIAAVFRLRNSCVGLGFFRNRNPGCGLASDGSGFNGDEGITAAHCLLDCSGLRDADWARHSDFQPDTPQNFVCPLCSSGPGPCGRQVHCAAAVVRQAAWDFATRDLRGAPFNYDAETAFTIAGKIFFQGSGNVRRWHSCSCLAGTSKGCRAASGYMQWLAADDDNGNLSDGTPHMTALFAAFQRHHIACSDPSPKNAPCGPTQAPSLATFGGDNEATLVWSAVPGASHYWVFRGEGVGSCQLGKVRRAEVTGTTFVDHEVADGRQYCYSVMPVGASDACLGPSSNTSLVTPARLPFAVTCSPATLSAAGGTSATATCLVTSIDGFSGPVNLNCLGQPAGAVCGYSPLTVNVPTGGGASSTLTFTLPSGIGQGTRQFLVTANGAGKTDVFPMSVVTPARFLTCNPGALTATPGGTATTTCTFFSDSSLTTGVTLSCDDLQPGTTCAFSPSTLSVPPHGLKTAALTVSVPSTATPVAYTFQAVALSANGSTAAPVGLTVDGGDTPDFSVSCDPPVVESIAGASTTNLPLTCTVRSLNGFAGSVQMSCFGQPPGTPGAISCDFQPLSFALAAGQTRNVATTVHVASIVGPGTYTFQVRAASGGVIRSWFENLFVEEFVP